MEDEQARLKEKATLLLRRERELFAMRVKHEQAVSWLHLAQSLPAVIDRTRPLEETFKGLRRALLMGLKLQRVAFFELEDGAMRPVGSTEEPRQLGSEAAAALAGARSGYCNDGTDETAPLQAVAHAVGLHRFIWGRIHPLNRKPVLLVAGCDKEKSQFQVPFEDSDAVNVGNMAQHVETLLGNAFLVNELEQDKARLEIFNQTLEHRVDERTRELGEANREIAANLTELKKKDKRLNDDLEQARNFQQSILPVLPEADTVAFGALYHPVDLVGGDIYDVCQFVPGCYRVFLADATGHGVQASLRTIVLKSEYDRLKNLHDTPDEVVADLNERLMKSFRPLEMLSTGCCFDIDLRPPRGPLLRYTNAVNPELLRVSGRKVETIFSQGALLGLPSSTAPALIDVPLAAGDVLVAYSDGACEQTGTSGEIFDVKAAVERAAQATADPRALLDAVWRELESFRGDTPLGDDVTMVAARIGDG
jgi:serine phosphatase RsbU (regulator of sigma subunit)